MEIDKEKFKNEVDEDTQRLFALTNILKDQVKRTFSEQDAFGDEAPVVGRESFDPDELAQSVQIFLDKASQDDSADMGIINDMQSELDDAQSAGDIERLEELYMEAAIRWPFIAITTGPTGTFVDSTETFGTGEE